MSRSGLNLTLVQRVCSLFAVSLLLSGYHAVYANQPLNAQTAKSKIVYACKKVRKGQEFAKDDLEFREILQSRASCIDIYKMTDLLERRASRDIARGVRLTRQEIMLADVNKWTTYDELDENKPTKPGYGKVVVAKQDLPQGLTIAVPSVFYHEIKVSKIPKKAIKHRRDVLGKTPKDGICMGQFIKEDELVSCEKE